MSQKRFILPICCLGIGRKRSPQGRPLRGASSTYIGRWYLPHLWGWFAFLGGIAFGIEEKAMKEIP